ncbi:isocitrate dehydrogenase [NAD] subunit gamma, mitochondrial isoform X2 [Agrilus planipennis]|uniref:Isocitrate dehydrogenase [NAD] subunit gamma, mitochondrial isoform X2 n=1 Tax=Agrilus planipennis TaxID=224129 RepID=A0A1W4X5J0_AGRPL|nr:isocitrate dehydrogenase [NAD] subunit gamma, mitochondrial isoform X2 [Agrilus planipennis]
MLSKTVNFIRRNRSALEESSRRFLPTLSSDKITLPQHKTPLKDRIQPIPVPLYGGRHMVTMLPGVGVGPELMNYVRDIFSFVGVPVDFEVITIDPRADRDTEVENIILSIKRNRVTLKSNLSSDEQDMDQPEINVILRGRLDLYVNVLHCKSYPGVPAKHENVDLVVIRQNTEGEYAMLEHENRRGVVESLKIITEKNTRRLARWAFQYARENGRKKITVVHKANILTLSDGLFLRTVQKVAKKFPEIELNDLLIDNCCMRLVKDPHQFDVLVMPNLYGMILSNTVCGMLGGPGLYAGQNFSDSYGLFETGIRTAGLKIADIRKGSNFFIEINQD